MGHSAVPSTAWGRAVGAAPGWARGDRRWPDKRSYRGALARSFPRSNASPAPAIGGPGRTAPATAATGLGRQPAQPGRQVHDRAASARAANQRRAGRAGAGGMASDAASARRSRPPVGAQGAMLDGCRHSGVLRAGVAPFGGLCGDSGGSTPCCRNQSAAARAESAAPT